MALLFSMYALTLHKLVLNCICSVKRFIVSYNSGFQTLFLLYPQVTKLNFGVPQQGQIKNNMRAWSPLAIKNTFESLVQTGF